MSFPDNLKYSDSHEWIRVDGDLAYVGITHHAVEQLGDIVFVEATKDVGSEVEQGEAFGEIESTKTASELFAPISGEIVEVQEDLENNLDLFSESPYEGAWIVSIRVQNSEELNSLMSAKDYENFVAQEEH